MIYKICLVLFFCFTGQSFAGPFLDNHKTNTNACYGIDVDPGTSVATSRNKFLMILRPKDGKRVQALRNAYHLRLNELTFVKINGALKTGCTLVLAGSRGIKYARFNTFTIELGSKDSETIKFSYSNR